MNNLLEKFGLEVEKYSEEVSKQTNVVGIILTGSAGRRDFDQYSDIDNVVVVKGKHSVKEGKFVRGEFLFDTRVVTINELGVDWSDDMYFAYLNSSIVDDSEGLIKNIFKARAGMWKSLVSKKISISLVELSTIYEFKDNWKSLKTKTHYKKFIERKDYLSAHRLLNLGFEIILNTLYLSNLKPVPDNKNKIKLLHTLDVITPGIADLFTKAYIVKSIDNKDLNRRYDILNSLVLHTKKALIKKIKLPDDLYKFYLKERK